MTPKPDTIVYTTLGDVGRFARLRCIPVSEEFVRRLEAAFPFHAGLMIDALALAAEARTRARKRMRRNRKGRR